MFQHYSKPSTGSSMNIQRILAIFILFVSIVLYLYIHASSPYYLFSCIYINVPQSYCPQPTEIRGFVKPGFEEIKEKFRLQFQLGLQTAAQVSVIQNGETVVNLEAGNVWIDPLFQKEQPISSSTYLPVYSAGKIVESLVFSMLEDRGLLSYTEKISTYWPEFANNGKENITIETLMKHQAGLLRISPRIRLQDQNNASFLFSTLSSQVPTFKPNSQQCYHPITRGLYVNEILRKVDPLHRNFSQFVNDEIISKLGTDMKYSLGTARLNAKEDQTAFNIGYPTLRLLVNLLRRIFPIWIQDLFLSKDPSLEIIYDLIFPTNGSCTQSSLDGFEEGTTIGPMMNAPNWRLYSNPSYATLTNAHSLARIAEIFLGVKDHEGNELLGKKAIEKTTSFLDDPLFDDFLKIEIPLSPSGLGDLSVPFNSTLGKLVGWMGAGGPTIFVVPHKNLVFSYIPVASTYKLFDDRAIQLWKTLEKIIS